MNAQIGTGTSKQVWGGVQAPIAPYALKEVPGVQNAVRLVNNYEYGVFKYQDKYAGTPGENGTYYVDPSIFKVFDFKLLKGDPEHPFPTDQSIIITKTTAKRFFGNTDPIGQGNEGLDNKDNYTVAGRYCTDFPENSSIKADMLFSIELTS